MPGRRFRAASLNLLRGAERFPPLPENTPFAAVELVTKTRTNEKVVRESSGEQLLKGYRGEIAQRLMNTASVVEQQVFRNRI